MGWARKRGAIGVKEAEEYLCPTEECWIADHPDNADPLRKAAALFSPNQYVRWRTSIDEDVIPEFYPASQSVFSIRSTSLQTVEYMALPLEFYIP